MSNERHIRPVFAEGVGYPETPGAILALIEALLGPLWGPLWGQDQPHPRTSS